MPTEEIGALHAVLSAASAQFSDDMGKARRALTTNAAKMERAMDRVAAAFKKTGANMKRYAAFAGGVVVASFIALMKKSLDTAVVMGKLSQSLGVDIEKLSTLAAAAKMSGLELDDFADALQTLSENATEFSIGAGPAVEAFKALQIQVKNTNGTIKDSDVLLVEIADKFSKLKDDSIKTTFAIQLFSDTGAKLIPFLNKGPKGIEDLRDRARDLGLELNKKTVAAATEFNARLHDLTANVSGVGMRIANDLIPALNQMIGSMAQAWASGDKLGTVLWKTFRAPGELRRTTEEFEKWAEIQRKMSGTKMEQLEVLPYKLVDVEGRKNEAKAMMLIARNAEENRKLAAVAAGERKKQEQDTLKALDKEREKESQALAARLGKIKAQEEAETQKKAEAKAAIAAAENAVKARLQLGESTIGTMQKERDLFSATSREQRVAWEIEQGNLSDLSVAHQQKILGLARELDVLEAVRVAQDKVTAAEKEAQGEAIQLQRKASQLMADRLSDEEKYVQAVRNLDDLFVSTTLSVVAYEAELARLGDVFATDLTRAVEGWGHRFSDVVTDAIMTGKASVRDFANSVIREFIRMQVQKSLTGPLFGNIASRLGGPGGGSPFSGLLDWVSGQRAGGGPVKAGSLYEVNERGPELLTMGNEQFLLMANRAGKVSALGGDASAPVAAGGQDLRIINVLDPAVVDNWASSPMGERTVINIIARNATQLKQVLN